LICELINLAHFSRAKDITDRFDVNGLLDSTSTDSPRARAISTAVFSNAALAPLMKRRQAGVLFRNVAHNFYTVHIRHDEITEDEVYRWVGALYFWPAPLPVGSKSYTLDAR